MAEVIALITQEGEGILLRVVPVDDAARRVLAAAEGNGESPEQYLFGRPKGGARFPPRVLALIAAIAYAHGTSRAVAAGTEVVVPAALMSLVESWSDDPATALANGLPQVFGATTPTRRIHQKKGEVRWCAPPDLDVWFVLDPGAPWCNRPHHGVTSVGSSASPLAQNVFWTVSLDACGRVTGPECPLRILVTAKNCETFLKNLTSALVERTAAELRRGDDVPPPGIVIYLLANEELVLHPPLRADLRAGGVEIYSKRVEVQAPYNFTMMIDANDVPRSLFWAAWSGTTKNPPYEHVGAAAIVTSPFYQQLCRTMHLGHLQSFGNGALSGGVRLPPTLSF